MGEFSSKHYLCTYESSFLVSIILIQPSQQSILRNTQAMTPKYLFPVVSLLATVFATPLQLQARDYSAGAIAQSTVSNAGGNCTSYLYYGESVNDQGIPRSCFAVALVCAVVRRFHQARFVVGNAGFTWSSPGKDGFQQKYHTVQNVVADMRTSNDWICRSGYDSYGKLYVSTYIEESWDIL